MVTEVQKKSSLTPLFRNSRSKASFEQDSKADQSADWSVVGTSVEDQDESVMMM